MVILTGNDEFITKKNILYQNQELKVWYYLKECILFANFYARVLN